MQAIFVTVKVKPEERQRFLEVIEDDARSSVRDEPGCVRFEVLSDAADENVYHFFEVYRDEQALAAHAQTPHFARWNAASKEVLSEEPKRVRTVPVFSFQES